MTESWDCDEARISLGVYVLGAIDPAERALVDAHLATCRECRDELADLAGIPALLARVNSEEIERIGARQAGAGQAGAGQAGAGQIGTGQVGWTEEQAPPELVSTVLDLAAARRRRTRWRYVASAAAVVALAGGIFGGLAASQAPSSNLNTAMPFSPGETSWEWASGTSGPTHATISYGSEHWGTVVAAEVWGIPVGTTCELWVVHADGTRTQIMSWTTADDESKVWYIGSMSMPSTDKGINSFQITQGPKLLVTVRPT